MTTQAPIDTSDKATTPYPPKKDMESSGMLEAGVRTSENENMAIRDNV